MDVPDWLIDFLDGISLWDAIAIFLVVGGLVWFVAKKGWRGTISFAQGILNVAKILDNVKELPGFIDRTDKALSDHSSQLEDIYHETHSNNGSSIKDAVDRTEKSVEGLHGRMDSVESSIAVLTKEDESIWAALEDTQNPYERGNDE